MNAKSAVGAETTLVHDAATRRRTVGTITALIPENSKSDLKGVSMKKVEAIVQPSRFDSVKDALREIGVEGMTVVEVRGHGRQKGHTETYRGREYTVDLLPKIKLEIVLPDSLANSAVEVILKTAKTGNIGDGKIFLSDVTEAIRIRNEERGEKAL